MGTASHLSPTAGSVAPSLSTVTHNDDAYRVFTRMGRFQTSPPPLVQSAQAFASKLPNRGGEIISTTQLTSLQLHCHAEHTVTVLAGERGTETAANKRANYSSRNNTYELGIRSEEIVRIHAMPLQNTCNVQTTTRNLIHFLVNTVRQVRDPIDRQVTVFASSVSPVHPYVDLRQSPNVEVHETNIS